jgi:hypothetical protein
MYRRRWGRLQTGVLYALIDHPEARSRLISSYIWDNPPTPSQLYSQSRAARSIARRVRREGQQWIWKLSYPRRYPNKQRIDNRKQLQATICDRSLIAPHRSRRKIASDRKK